MTYIKTIYTGRLAVLSDGRLRQHLFLKYGKRFGLFTHTSIDGVDEKGKKVSIPLDPRKSHTFVEVSKPKKKRKKS